MIRYATSPRPPPIDDDATSPHLYHRPRPTSQAHQRSTPFNFLQSLWHNYTSRRRHRRRSSTLPGWSGLTALITIIWLLLVVYYERYIWTSSIAACQWDSWERWPAGATPHRIVLVADPQLVDIHTYARRGASLAATIFYSDKYLARAWSLLHQELVPAEAYFLGDLFDGGREWGTSARLGEKEKGIGHDPHEVGDWRKNGMEYWIEEFRRFEGIFGAPAGVRMKRGMPGNHDLGFGGGVKLSARGRFSAFFGEGNDRWTAGNHTWVMVDAVSLSNEADPEIYAEVHEFLDGLDTVTEGGGKWPQVVESNPVAATPPPPTTPPTSQQPTVLLTHVPLYREKGTPCGPLREKGTAIPIWKGYQYQNVLTQELSSTLLKKTHAKYVFSGDDHDACDVTHMYGPQGLVREWTVKSISWTMGVRRPGFEMVSMWNPGTTTTTTEAPPLPLDDDAPARVPETPAELTARLGPDDERNTEHLAPPPPEVHGDQDTLHSHLCLLPDQIGIFLTYLKCLAVTVMIVCLNVWWTRRDRRARREGGAVEVLPMAQTWKGMSVREDGGQGKYWKPRPRQALGRFWWVTEIVVEMGRMAAVAVAFYAVLLWRW
ncbi:hypothetical protein BZA05DRAFT_405687 [Tricharina praecox]|uniref:uncharacterized protein n=1 Tax=Tricharina praecox TaxID=43433 RepID=UPI00221F52D5|nr:uncharacterized protein BZA05DRAFT_405687 [Tricharina praecox]KAI5846863.1 hypothetical protein BZA05DRAFT_405687 [Tricharina praecox]